MNYEHFEIAMSGYWFVVPIVIALAGVAFAVLDCLATFVWQCIDDFESDYDGLVSKWASKEVENARQRVKGAGIDINHFHYTEHKTEFRQTIDEEYDQYYYLSYDGPTENLSKIREMYQDWENDYFFNIMTGKFGDAQQIKCTNFYLGWVFVSFLTFIVLCAWHYLPIWFMTSLAIILGLFFIARSTRRMYKKLMSHINDKEAHNVATVED